MKKIWESAQIDEKEVERISKEFQIHSLLASILQNRNLTKKEEIEVFLNPTRKDFHNPFLMPDMEIAVDRILKAIEKKETILIYGDYDVDGITSITVLKQFLQERQAIVEEYIPNRLEEGYGLNQQAIQELAKTKKYSLMITVDCGITGLEEIELAKELGIETIVTDHHEPTEILPNAVAVIDAKRKDNQYPFNQLAGCGVVFKLIQAISQKLELPEEAYLKYLDIVCVGTISDIVPLIDENRVIAKLGLKLVQVTRNIGLRVLLEHIGYKKIDSTAISFGIAPRINACGRMGHQEEALKLFLTKDRKEAKEIALKLNEYNSKRQETEKKIYSEVISMIENTQEAKKDCIVLGKEDWHHGIIGIVASKVTDLYYKPSILVCFENGEGKGSGRSIPGFDLHEALNKCDRYIERFGGHSMAIGLTVTQKDFPKFKEEFEQYAQNSNIRDMIPIIQMDKEISLKQVTKEAVEELSKLEPFGEANKVPLFFIKNLKIQAIRALSEGKHVKMTFQEDNILIDAIGFNLGIYASEYQIGDRVDVAGTLEMNEFNGNYHMQINLKDMRKTIL